MNITTTFLARFKPGHPWVEADGDLGRYELLALLLAEQIEKRDLLTENRDLLVKLSESKAQIRRLSAKLLGSSCANKHLRDLLNEAEALLCRAGIPPGRKTT